MPPDPILVVFSHSADAGRSLARDMRVRWALSRASHRPVFAQTGREDAHAR